MCACVHVLVPEVLDVAAKEYLRAYNARSDIEDPPAVSAMGILRAALYGKVVVFFGHILSNSWKSYRKLGNIPTNQRATFYTIRQIIA